MPPTTTQNAATKPADQYTWQQKVDMFRATATDLQARQDFAASRAEVIIPLLQQQSTIRAIFNPEVLPPGADARYDIPFEDIDAVWVMPQIGAVPTIQVEGAEIHVDTFGVDGGVEYQQDIARDGRFQVAQLATTLLKQKFVKQEEYAGWGLIKAHEATLAATSQRIVGKDDNNLTAGTKKLNIYTINEVLTVADGMGTGGRRVTDIYCSPRRFGDLRAMVQVLALPEDMRENIWSNGQIENTIANIRFHRVYDSNLVSDNKAYAFTQREGYFYGVMPIRQELQTIDNVFSPMEWKIGIQGRQRFGLSVIDDKGLLVVDFT